MKTLPLVRPTAEQLPLIGQNRLGVEVIRGAAGSGKTSTAILRLRSLSLMFEERRARNDDNRPVNVLVLTFNRTLRGYVERLAHDQIGIFENVTLQIDTFGRWASHALGAPNIITTENAEAFLIRQARSLPLPSSYIIKEVDYLLGRFRPGNLEDYITAERTGRGLTPRVDRDLRRKILSDVVEPYREFLIRENLWDWNDIAIEMARVPNPDQLDVIIVDEAQDFSANQLRAVRHHVAEEHAVTFVIDTMQRIYARGFTWLETGFDIRPNRYHTLQENHRNTVEIARFAAGILHGVVADDDGSLPNLDAATRHGPTPVLIQGLYSQQVEWAIARIKDIDIENESVAFLSPLGGNFFTHLKLALTREGINFEDITRRQDWPGGDVNVAISTFHSAKGLEFDHVFILGMSDRNTPHNAEEVDDQLHVLRRLFAVGVARARETVTVGYKQGEQSVLIGYLQPGTFERIIL